MARASNKHLTRVPVRFDPTGGLNLSVPPHAIGENELSSAYNTIYEPSNGRLTSRPAFRCYTQSPATGSPKFNNMMQFEQNILLSADDGNVYEYNTTTFSFNLVHSLTPGVVASMIVFNSKALIADGTKLVSWDGSSVTDLNSLEPTAICEVSNRVVTNSATDPDAIYFSGPEDATDWNTVDGAAVMLRAGYGDGMEVNGLAVMGKDLIVSKAGRGKRSLYRIHVDGAATSWVVQPLISDTSAKAPQLMTSVPNNVVYINNDAELRGVAGVQEYGDISMINFGEKINPGLINADADGYSPTVLRYLPSYDMLAIVFSGMIYAYYPGSNRFTYFDGLTMGVRISSCCDYNNTPIFGGDNGHIYYWDNKSSDEYVWESWKPFSTRVRSKTHSLPGEMVLKRTRLSIDHLSAGNGTIEVNEIIIKRFTIDPPGWFLFDANEELYSETRELYSADTKSDIIKIRNRVRQKDFFFELRTSSGRLATIYIESTFAMVNG